MSTGNARRIRKAVTKIVQQNMGIRNMVMPGARRQTIVVMKLTAPRMVPSPDRTKPMIHKSPPAPGEWMASESGV